MVRRFTIRCLTLFYSVHDIHALNDLTKDHMFHVCTCVMSFSSGGGDEELRSVCVCSWIGHWQYTKNIIFENKIFILKFPFIYWSFAGSIIIRSSPPWIMKLGIVRWKELPLNPNPFSCVQRHQKFSTVNFLASGSSSFRVGWASRFSPLSSPLSFSSLSLFRYLIDSFYYPHLWHYHCCLKSHPNCCWSHEYWSQTGRADPSFNLIDREKGKIGKYECTKKESIRFTG